MHRQSLRTAKASEGAGTRTQDQRIKSPLLYRLSYALACAAGRRHTAWASATQACFGLRGRLARQTTSASGADRIRTCGTSYPVHRFSKPALSTTQPPLLIDSWSPLFALSATRQRLGWFGRTLDAEAPCGGLACGGGGPNRASRTESLGWQVQILTNPFTAGKPSGAISRLIAGSFCPVVANSRMISSGNPLGRAAELLEARLAGNHNRLLF